MTKINYKRMFTKAIRKNADNPKWDEGDFIGIKTVSNTKVGNIGQDFVEEALWCYFNTVYFSFER